MSRKDFLKRAMAATVDAPLGAAIPPPVAPPQRSSTTSPGAMLEFMQSRSDAHLELEAAKKRLAEFEGANIARKLDPGTVAPSAYANRLAPSFGSTEFDALKQNIQEAGGNLIPIKVRPVGRPGMETSYEIVYGHRRHRACQELGLPVLAFIDGELSDQDLFLEMERENRHRMDLSAWEQGLHYARALDSGLFPSLRKLAEALGAAPATISAALVIARLPEAVIAAFPSPLDLSLRWSTALREALQKDPDGLIRRAEAIAAMEKRPAAAETLKLLVAPEIPAAVVRGKEWINAEGKVNATLSVDARGRPRLVFGTKVSPADIEAITALVDKILG